MPQSWKYKLYTVIASFLIALYLLVPTVFRLDSKMTALENNGQPIPSYMKLFPRKTLNLGLDLQGGIYVEMQVNLNDAIKRKTDLFGTDLERYLKDKNTKVIASTQPAVGTLHVQLDNSADVDIAVAAVNTEFAQMFMKQSVITEDEHPTLVLVMQKTYRDYLENNVAKQALETVRNRIDRYGVSEPDITRQGADRIAIELPGLSDPDRAISIIKRTGQLEFRLVDDSKNATDLEQMVSDARKENNIPEGYNAEVVAQINKIIASKLPATSELGFELVRDNVTKKVVRGIPYLISKKADVTGDMLQDARVSIDNNEPKVNLTFDKTGTANFGDLTKNNVKKRLAILLDGYVNKAPVINEPILTGHAQITLGYGDYQQVLKEAEDLSLVLQEGALPASLSEATKTVVGPSLGLESIMSGLRASAIAAFLVVLFMIFYYRMSGLYADIALGLNMMLILAVLSIFGATLTLPGITGMILTMGMAVDANILICERIREELRAGKQVKSAVESGYSNAMRAVIDTHITTLISGIVLYQFGTGPIKGFAVTLSVGILTTLYTAVVVTRLIYDYRIIKHKVTTISI